MNGYIVKHAVFGIGKIVDWSDLVRQPFRVRFCAADSKNQEVSFDRSALGRQIARAVLPPGSRCRSRRGGCVIVDISKFASDGLPTEYEVEFDKDGGLRATLAESELEPATLGEVRDPALLLGGLQAGGYPIFRARERLAESMHQLLRDGNGLRALLSSRIDLRPHQAYVAGVALLDRRRRYLLADEVGLGKTIEAGIILADLLAQKPDASILVVTPGTLTQQWLCELYVKFGLDTFVMPDLRGGRIDWRDVSRAIVSMTGALDSGAALKGRRWDLLIVDEAHHLLGSGPLYELAMALSQRATGLLLLSALPAQERKDEFLRLLALLEPERYERMSSDDFAKLYGAQQDVGRKIRLVSRRLQDLAAGEGTAEEVLIKAAGLLELPALQDDAALRSAIDSLAAVATSAGADDPAEFCDRCQRLRHYVGDAYRINRRILRNRRQRLAEDAQIELVPRRLKDLGYQPDQMEIEVTQAVQSLLSAAKSASMPDELLIPLARTLYQSLSHPAATSSVLHRLAAAPPDRRSPSSAFLSSGHLVGYDEWDKYLDALVGAARRYCDDGLIDAASGAATAWVADVGGPTRVNQLVEFLKSRQSARRSGEAPKVLLFAGFPGVAAGVAKRLQAEFGAEAVASFHHDLSREDKERNVTRFRTNPRTCVLVCDESGGEGRNFQFASEIVHFDTPWYASRVEQRIGRLDRLGREREPTPEVVSNVLYNQWSAEAGLVRCYRDGLEVYTRSLSGLEFALREVERSIAAAAVSDGITGAERMVPEIQAKAGEERARDESDAVFDAASFERSAADKYWRVSDSSELEPELEEAFTDYFQMIASSGAARPLNDERTPQGLWLLSPADVRHVKLPLEPESDTGVPRRRKGTFRRAIAQTRPDLDFFTVGNELFDAVVASMADDGVGRTYAVECVAPGIPPWLGFELVLAPTPRLSVLGEDDIGLRNRARQIVHARPIHVFVGIDCSVVEDAAAEALLHLRRSLRRETKDRLWWNLTKEKAPLVQRAFPNSRLLHAVAEAQNKARVVARERLDERLARDLEEENRRIDEMIRLGRTEGLSADGLAAAAAQADVEAFEDYRKAIRDWLIRVDAIGFLSVNGGLKS